MDDDPYRSPGAAIELPERPSRLPDSLMLGLCAGGLAMYGGFLVVRETLRALNPHLRGLDVMVEDLISLGVILLGYPGPVTLLALLLGRRHRRAALGAWIALVIGIGLIVYQVVGKMLR